MNAAAFSVGVEVGARAKVGCKVGAGVGKLRQVMFILYWIWHGTVVDRHVVFKPMVEASSRPISRLEGVEMKHVVACKLEPSG